METDFFALDLNISLQRLRCYPRLTRFSLKEQREGGKNPKSSCSRYRHWFRRWSWGMSCNLVLLGFLASRPRGKEQNRKRPMELRLSALINSAFLALLRQSFEKVEELQVG